MSRNERRGARRWLDPRGPSGPSSPSRPPEREQQWNPSWDDAYWEEEDAEDAEDAWGGSQWEPPPWAERERQQRELGADQPREAGLESAFGGYVPDAATMEMRAIPDSVLFEEPHSPGPVTKRPLAPAPPDRPAPAPPRRRPTGAPPPFPPPAPRAPGPPAPPVSPTPGGSAAPPPAAPPTRPAPQRPPPLPPTRQPSAPPIGPPPAAPPPTAPPTAAPRPEQPPPSRRASFMVAAGILASRVSGLVREVVIARYLGTSGGADAFRAALRIPNLLQNLLGEGVLSASFIPVYARLRSENDQREAGRLAGAIAGLLIALTGLLSVLGLVLAGPITKLITPGLAPGIHDLAVTLVRIMFPGIGFLVLSAWCLGVLNSHRRFFLSYVAPVLWNAAQIVALLAVAMTTDDQRSMATALAWGVLGGGILQLAVQIKPTMALLGRLQLSFDTRRASVHDVLRRFGPVLLSRGSVQLLAFFDLVLASWLMAGALASMGYAQVLYLLPISLFGMSVAAAELPDLSKVRVFDPPTRRMFRRRLEDGMARIGFYVGLTATLFIVAGDVVVHLLFERGNFDSQDTKAVWVVLGAFAIGLPAVTSSRLLINGLFALDDAKTPARLAVVRVALAAAIGFTLMFPLDRLFITPDGDIAGWGNLWHFTPWPESMRGDSTMPPHLGIVGLGLGTSIAAWVEYRMLQRALAVQIGRTRLAGRWLNPIAACCGLTALVALAMTMIIPDSAPSLIRAAFILGPAGSAYLAAANWLRVPEAKALLSRVSR